jgi:hypothetical protein
MARSPLFRWLRDESRARQQRRRFRPHLESLEHRLAPVIGANALAPVVARGGDFDGVVALNGCTGSLLPTSRHIISAAHCVDNDGTTGTLGADAADNVLFEMSRGGNPVDINIPVPAAFIAVNPGWQGANNIGSGNDVIILRLTDQVNSAINRHLIAPFGAQRYAIFPGNNEVGQNYTIVGYGETGTGATGEQSDEVQRVSIGSPVGGGTFTLTFNGQTTAAIAQNANSQAVAAALRALANISQDGAGVANVVVSNAGLAANTWDVRFVNQLGYTDVNALTGAATGGATVNVATQFNGNQPGINNVKHQGQNRYDVTAIGNTALRSDWDNGNAANDAIGGNAPADTGFAARGDSGGPGFIRNTTLNTWEIATVVSFTQAQNSPPDINNYVDGNGAVRRDNSFGEARTDTRLSSFNGAGGFIPTTIAGNYDLVLDMQQQVLGQDGLTENLTIIVRQNGANLEIEVVNNSSAGTFAGIYYTAPLTEILSLTLRGSGDNETFRIEGDLNLNMTVAGRGGTDTLQMLNTTATYTPDGTNQPSQGTINAYGDNTIQFTGLEFVTPVAPEITSFGLNQAAINENDTVTMSVQFTDPGSLSSHEVTIVWGDGQTDVFNLAVGSRSFTRDHQYLDDDPTGTPQDIYPIQITITDNDNLTDSGDTQITVSNVDPVITTLSNSSPECGGTSEGDPITISGEFSDAGTLDTHTVLIDWGDGTPATPGIVIQGSGSGSFSGGHVYTSGGIFQITVTLTDDDTGSDVDTTQIMISGAGVLNGTLYVIGTNDDDQIQLNEQGTGQTKVNTDFLPATKAFSSSSFTQIVIVACGGGDHVNVSGGLTKPTLVDGGDGDDHLNGGGGRNILIGGDGADRLVGAKGDDLLIASGTTFTGHTVNLTTVDAVLAAWNAGTAYAVRRAAVDALLTPLLVEDGDADQLTGSAGTDLFFANLIGGVLDKITDLKSGEGSEEI